MYPRHQPGQRLNNIPAQAMNGLYRLLEQRTQRGAEIRTSDATEILILNNTGGVLSTHDIVAVGDVLYTPTENEAEYRDVNCFVGNTPTASATIAVVQEPISVDGIGLAVIQGVTACRLNVTSESDTHAAPTTSTTQLTTGSSGTALILWKESGTGTGKKAKVLLGGMSLADVEVVTLDVVTKVCVTTLSGGMPSYTFQHEKYDVLAVRRTTESYCSEGDDDCCPDIWLDCATERELSVESLPSSLVLRIRGHGDAGCTAIDVCFPLIATNDPSIKYHDHPCWVAYIDDLPGVAPGTFVTLNYSPCSSPYPPVMGDGWLPADTYFWWQWRNGGNLSPDDGYCNLGTHDTGGTTLHAFASVNDTEAYAPLALVSEGVAFGALGVASGCCDSVDGTNYLTLEAYDTDADCVSGGGDPGTDGCCADASDLAMFLDSTGSFDSLTDSYTLVYDPTEIDSQLNGDAAWADQFQWYVELHDGTILYFGCAGGTHYVGIKAGSPIYDCFDTMTAHTLFKVQTVVAAVSCTESTYVTTALTADGGTGCVGDFNLTIYR